MGWMWESGLCAIDFHLQPHVYSPLILHTKLTTRLHLVIASSTKKMKHFPHAHLDRGKTRLDKEVELAKGCSFSTCPRIPGWIWHKKRIKWLANQSLIKRILRKFLVHGLASSVRAQLPYTTDNTRNQSNTWQVKKKRNKLHGQPIRYRT